MKRQGLCNLWVRTHQLAYAFLRARLNLKKLEHRRLKLLFGPLSEAVTPGSQPASFGFAVLSLYPSCLHPSSSKGSADASSL